MAALAPPECGSRLRHAGKAAEAALLRRPASFHGRQQQRDRLLGQRTRTHPDLHLPAGGSRAAPSKLLVTVAVQRSMWPLHVMARAEWRVADLVAAAVELYVREGRRPLLPCAEPSAFGLHYSQFSLQGLDPEAKLVELGSRSFFLCPRAAAADASSTCSSTEASEADKPGIQVPRLRFVHFWPLV